MDRDFLSLLWNEIENQRSECKRVQKLVEDHKASDARLHYQTGILHGYERALQLIKDEFYANKND